MPDDDSKLKNRPLEDEEELDPLDDETSPADNEDAEEELEGEDEIEGAEKEEEAEETPRATPRSLDDIEEEMQKPRKTFEGSEPGIDTSDPIPEDEGFDKQPSLKVSQEDFKRNLGLPQQSTFKSNIPGEHTLDDLAEEELPERAPVANRNIDYGSDVELEIPNLRSKPFKEPPLQTGYSARPNNYNNYSNPSFRGSGRSSKVHLIILALIGLSVIGGTVYLLKSQFSDKFTSQPSPTPVVVEATPTPSPSPTPEALTRSEYKVRVLNGTTTSGLAASVSAKLKELGYEIERTGNASNQALKQTTVKVKSGEKALMEQLIKDLSPDYEATGSTDLKDSDPSEAEVSIGAR